MCLRSVNGSLRFCPLLAVTFIHSFLSAENTAFPEMPIFMRHCTVYFEEPRVHERKARVVV